MKLRFVIIFLNFFFFGLLTNAQNAIELDWGNPISYGLEGKDSEIALYFNGAKYDFSESSLPFYYEEIEGAEGRTLVSVKIESVTSEKLDAEEIRHVDKNLIPTNFDVKVENSLVRKKNRAYIKFTPLFKSKDGGIEKILSLDLSYNYIGSSRNGLRKKSHTFAASSKMANGSWYKIGVVNEGIYKLKYSFLESLGVDVENIDPRNLKVFGYGGGALPEANNIYRPDDMLENPIMAVGEQDGEFDEQDYFLFYGDSQVEWVYDSSLKRFDHLINSYSDTTFYFIAITEGPGKRINSKPIPSQTPNVFVSSYDYLEFHEKDEINLIKSGREWVGEVFDNRLNYSFSWDVPNLILSEPATAEIYVVARAGATSTFSILAESSAFSTAVSATVLDRYEVSFAKPSRKNIEFPLQNNPINLSITYNKPQAVAKAWLNYIDLNVRRSLVHFGSSMSFRDSRTVGVGNVTEFSLRSNRRPLVWDITEPGKISAVQLNQNGNQYSFIDETSSLNEYISFTVPDSTNIIPIGEVANQNLHALSQADMIIVTNPKFLAQALDLAELRKDEGLSVHTVTTNQVFNEFSSGAQDIVAIRMLMKMLYDRASNEKEMPKYLLLFGDASYDLKNRVNGNTNYVVSYHSRNFLEPVYSYVSDDFIGLLDDDEGTWPLRSNNPERLDIGIGRFPVKRVDEAEGVLRKMKSYNTSNNLSDWRNKIVFVGDDEDGITHMSQADQLASYLDREYPDVEIQKVLLDAFKQESTSSGNRYPEANRAINRAVQNGAFILNYTGHGGETGWAEERILSIDDISSWEGMTNMPIFVTATCEFSRYDDPFRTSAGELVLLNQRGGGVALMTTTRLVYSSPNFSLNQSFYQRVFRRDVNGEFKRLGDIFMQTKNLNAGTSNSRNFSLLGDPSLKMVIPKYNVITTQLNGKNIGDSDTLKALSKATISGYIADENGKKLSNFNGSVYPTIFDKVRKVQILNNDGGNIEWDFEQRDSRIFKGKASVVNGDFSFTFVVPKDIVYSYGKGKINYYATNGIVDANGANEKIVVGGNNDSALLDNTGPQIEVFMNDESFVYGGITNANPVLLAKVYDELGVNTAGNGLGHDLVAEIDGDSKNTFVLNDYYEAESDSYQKGVIRFPLKNLSEGKHTLRLKAWDVANNSSEKTIEFVVAEEKELKIENLVNYPNPFTTNTQFIFQHNQAGVPLDIKLEIFTVSGKLVKSFDQVVINEGYMSRDINWNGRDDFGDKIGKGVYVYKLKVKSGNGSVAEKIEKLVIL